MFYRKNVYAWEQVLRILGGIGMIVAGIFFVPGWVGYLLDGNGVYLILTGFFGYCPACAMIGRKPIERP